jgi:hypothetical protein
MNKPLKQLERQFQKALWKHLDTILTEKIPEQLVHHLWYHIKSQLEDPFWKAIIGPLQSELKDKYE